MAQQSLMCKFLLNPLQAMGRIPTTEEKNSHVPLVIWGIPVGFLHVFQSVILQDNIGISALCRSQVAHCHQCALLVS